MTASPLSCYIIGADTLLMQCADTWREAGHELRGVISAEPRIVAWCTKNQIPVLAPGADLGKRLAAAPRFDILFAITHLEILPADVLATPLRMAINFHDGPLPRYAGLNATTWALLNGETSHGITWHTIGKGVDDGEILLQVEVPIQPGDSSLTLNARCFETAMASFKELVQQIGSNSLAPRQQDLSQRSYFGRHKRPARAGVLDWQRPRHELVATVRALDFGGYRNPLLSAKVLIGSDAVIVGKAETLEAGVSGVPGTILEVRPDALVVQAEGGAVLLRDLANIEGKLFEPGALASAYGLVVGAKLPQASAELAARLTETAQACAKQESFWTERLSHLDASPVPWAEASHAPQGQTDACDFDLPGLGSADHTLAGFAAFLARFFARERVDFAVQDHRHAGAVRGLEHVFAPRLPLRLTVDLGQPFAATRQAVAEELATVRARGGFPRDLLARTPELAALAKGAFVAACPIAVDIVAQPAEHTPWPGYQLALSLSADGTRARLTWDTSVLERSRVERLRGQLVEFLHGLQRAPQVRIAEQPLMSAAERERVLYAWNATARDGAHTRCVHDLIRAQVARTPNAIAVRSRGKTLTYAELDRRSDRLAVRLQALGVGPDQLVGVYMKRTVDLPVALLAIHKAGGAYVPLDPDYPADRIAFMAEDAGLRAAVVDADTAERFPAGSVPKVDVATAATDADAAPAPSGTTPAHLAYVIFTSGSTGKPKGVMIQHGNAVNFFAGMDERLGTQPGVWLAVTSLSFDISVLELLWTLARGFEVVVYAGHEAMTQGSTTCAPTGPELSRAARPISFSLFYFASDEGEGVSDKYKLLLDGARFADQNGFEAVWTPERHFHAFGGLYPNPSVASAAIAAVTERVKIRAGSCVLPLHHPIRIAEEWALVDNLSKGRVGIAFAAGWQPNDFVLRPENFAERKQKMFEGIEQVRALWRGGTAKFKGPKGNDVEVRTLPRPVQRELPVWVTIAGNPQTYVEAGRAGHRILTHLLGQSVEELAEKLQLYRAAWREAAHPGRPHVTLMLHTYVGDDDAAVKEAVRAPMREYLRSAMDLVKAAAWSFPTFKDRVASGGQSMDQLFAGGLSQDEVEALLDHAFERYYYGSALFGTVETCLEMVRQLKALEVDEIGCLVDFGIPSAQALKNLDHLNRLKQAVDAETASAQAMVAADDSSIPALIERHKVTHFQCTPSMAAMLLMDERAKEALRRLQKVMIGGEAFPAAQARELCGLIGGEVWNMYGPTETTVWSTCGRITKEAAAAGEIRIGTPLVNQRVYILDAMQQPAPIGVAGELWIAGDGVARGYLARPDLTAERFVRDPFRSEPDARMYRTGDLAAWTERGELAFYGRIDHQVKVRGYRIELGEIEAALRAHASVRDAVVVAREDTPGDKRLVAYVIPTCNIAGCHQDTLKEHLRANLPDFMVPAHVVQLERFPLTPNKKIDRKALPAPDHAEQVRSTPFEATSNDVETTIAEIWRKALGVERVGANDNFFDLGGHSLLAVKVHREVQQAVGREFSITALFQFPTVRSLAASLANAGQPSERVQESESRGEARRASLAARQRIRPTRN